MVRGIILSKQSYLLSVIKITKHFRLVVGSICGAVLMFESVLKRTVWHDKFELTYVTHSQLLLKSLQESDSTVLIVESQLGLEIDDVRFMGICSITYT